MAEIDGKYEGPSVTRALARSKYKKSKKAQESTGATGGPGGPGHEAKPGVHAHLARIHEGAEGAKKSFHVYQHEDGTHHAHAHDHEANTHEHQVHPDIESAGEHMQEHMGAGGEPGAEKLEAGMGTEEGGGMPSLGLGEQG